MNLFFEEDGAFKVGTEMSGTDSACQVELPTGKRIKVKRSHIFVTYNSPSPAEFLARAQQEAEEIDLEILWEFAPDDEFDFKTIAAEYFGDSVTPIQQAATILRLHSNPVYFYRKGRGKYRKAPAETLKLALAAIERKKKLDREAHDELPLSDAVAFSIDDSETTEIDDALSVTPLEDGKTRVGIHISAPGLGIQPGSDIDLVARERMSTVYAPGLKTTMLPKEWVAAFSLDEGLICPVVSLYAVVDNETLAVLSTDTRLERIKIEKNLRYDLIADKVTEEAIQEGNLPVPYGPELIWLWKFAKKLLKGREEVRGRPEPVGRIDWYFSLKGEDENAEIELKGRRRGDPLDLLVAEMMIFANSTWGGWLEERDVAGIYRSQRMGRVKMTSVPGPHDGIGVPYYAWSTSPLRRYVDMVNQRQIIATLKGEKAPYRNNDSELFSIISTFDSNYSAFNDFQSRMDRYWSMRWIEQEGINELKATVVKGDLVRIEGLPMAQRVPGLPELPRGQSVLMKVLNLDYLSLVMECSLIKVLNESHEEDLEEEEIEAEVEAPEAVPPEAPQAEGAEPGNAGQA